MKGTLHKTEQGWVVEHEVAEKTPIGYKSWWGTFPLHPNDVKICNQYGDYSVDWHGKEVEFDFVTEWENGEVGVNGLTYAKLINHSVGTNEMICMFEPRTDTSSATICKHCGQEKFLHNHVPDVGKMVEDDVVKLAEEYAFKVYHAFEDATWFRPLNLGYYAGYKKAKETLYTEEQVRKAIRIATTTSPKSEDYIIKSLKQPKQ
jgi:hypothetical protein